VTSTALGQDLAHGGGRAWTAGNGPVIR
jgi:hypothetical protein